MVFCRRFTCYECGESTDGKLNMTVHYIQAHKIFHCILCPYTFNVETVAVSCIAPPNYNPPNMQGHTPYYIMVALIL